MKGAVLALLVLGVSLATAVLSDDVAPAKRFFMSHLDRNGDGDLTAAEYAASFCRMNLCRKDARGQLIAPMEKIVDFIESHDSDDSQSLSLEEFAAVLPPKALSPIESGPQQVHIALTSRPDAIIVIWVTKDKVSSEAFFGTSSNVMNEGRNGTVTTYTAGILGGWKGWVHTVELNGLFPKTTYYYKVGSSMDNKWSHTFSFQNPAMSNDTSAASTVFALLGDQGTYIPNGHAVAQLMEQAHQQTPFTAILHVGDVCYAGTGSEYEVEEVWDIWGNMMEDLAANIPYMISVGNHEHYYNYSSYNTRFQFPGDEEAGGEHNFWYSLDIGKAHLLFMSTEHPFNAGSPQAAFIEQDLARANLPENRAVRPWIVVLGHRPVYSSSSVEYDQHSPGGSLTAVLEPLFLKYKVDVYFAGHMHDYERVLPNINGSVVAQGNRYENPSAPVYVVVGNGGTFTDKSSSFVSPQPAWSALRSVQYGFGRLTLTETTMHFEELYLGSNGQAADEFWITKS